MIFVTGAKGTLGSYLKKVFDERELYLTDCRVNSALPECLLSATTSKVNSAATDINFLDIRDPEAVKKEISKVNPQFVFHLAAKTNVDKCETEIEDAHLVNVIGTQNVALACQETGAIMVYIGTTEVFDGNKNEPYTEFDEPHPINIYGKTKFEGEKIVQNILNKYYIIRTCWMFGGKEKDNKFVGKIVKLFKEKEKIQVVDDKIGSPTYAYDLIAAIKELIKTGYYGLYHFTNKGSCSRYEMAREIGRILGKNIPVEPVSSSLFPLPAPRGKSAASRNYKLELLNIINARTWQDALREYLESWTI